jgi:hypothetical protein
MTTATATPSFFADPTASFEFRAFIFLDLIVSRVKLRILIEFARLSFLGFYDRLEKSLEQLAQAENAASSEPDIKMVVEYRMQLASSMDSILARLEPMMRIVFKDSTLGEYIAGRDRIDTLRATSSNIKLEQEAEGLIEHSKTEFLSQFARRRLTKTQRELLIERHRKLSVHQ